MAKKQLPFSKEKLEQIITQYPTPFHIYDEKGIRSFANQLKTAFAWNEGFKEYFAIKATPNPFIMKILQEEGFGIDCSSYAELLIAEKCGLKGAEIMFTSNDTPVVEYQKASDLNAIINLDDISHIDYLEKHVGLPEIISFRFNPGPMKAGNEIIGNPEEAKYGLTREQMFEAYAKAKAKGVKRFGIHTMVASNELDVNYFVETVIILFELIVEIAQKLDIKFEFANLGGGIGIPYRPEQQPVDIQKLSGEIKRLYAEMIEANGLAPMGICLESGRAITGPYGFLVTKVLHLKDTYKQYVGVDACMTNLMRPALYGAYHHITVMGKEDKPCDVKYDVTGSLCENNDKFAIDRMLPQIEQEDLVVIHDTGAHGHAMGFNYNGKLKSAELLIRESGEVVEIRRAETYTDHFATLDFDKLPSF